LFVLVSGYVYTVYSAFESTLNSAVVSYRIVRTQISATSAKNCGNVKQVWTGNCFMRFSSLWIRC